jgi:hypothetical protein
MSHNKWHALYSDIWSEHFSTAALKWWKEEIQQTQLKMCTLGLKSLCHSAIYPTRDSRRGGRIWGGGVWNQIKTYSKPRNFNRKFVGKHSEEKTLTEIS